MKQHINLLLGLLCWLVMATGCARKTDKPDTTSRIDSIFQAHAGFSGVALVADKGKPLFHKAFGYRDFDNKSKNDTTSIFELASLSKQFTAMTIMLLAEEGKLRYDDPIDQYIPGLPYSSITIRHLLNHTSGLPDYQAVMDQHWDKTKVAGNHDNIEFLIRYHPDKLFEPGEKYTYSNTGYMLLASIAEKASGIDFIEFMDRRIFIPLHMVNSAIRTRDQKLTMPTMAWGYLTRDGKFARADSFPQFNYAVWLGNRKGPGRVSSTTSDLLRWDRALYTEALVKKMTLNEAFAPARLNNDSLSYYGFGWDLGRHLTLGAWVGHTGENPGYLTRIRRYIETDKTIIILSNNEYGKIDDLLEAIEKLVATDCQK